MVTVIWETWLQPGSEQEGLALTQRIWSDMTSFDGYVSHSLLVDEDDGQHLLVVSTWLDRTYPDRALQDYAGAEPVQQITPLLARPRNRWVLTERSTQPV